MSRPVIGELLSRLGPAPQQPALVNSPADTEAEAGAPVSNPLLVFWAQLFGRRESLIANAEIARLSKKLVTLDCEAPVPVPGWPACWP